MPGASLLVRSPTGQERTVDLSGERVTVGRAAPGHRPDVDLGPDPRQWIGRTQCSLHLSGGIWSVRDNATVNSTLLLRNGTTSPIDDDARLHDGDELRILGDLAPDGTPRYWRLRFVDPHSTRGAPFVLTPDAPVAEPPCLEYDPVAARVYRRAGGERVEIHGLRPMAHRLVRQMMQRQRDEGVPVLVFTYAELAAALWGDPRGWSRPGAHTREDVRDVVSDLRRGLEHDPAHPGILQTVRGVGYRLVAWSPATEPRAGPDR